MSSSPMEIDSCIVPPASSILSPAAEPAATAGWRPTGWSDLPTNWLGYISVYLPLQCLSSSFLPVCRSWRDGLRAVPLRDEPSFTLKDERLARLGDASIDIKRHVTALRMTDALSPASLSLTHRLSHLGYLNCRIDCSSEDAETVYTMHQRRFEFPSQLSMLNLALKMSVDDDALPRWAQCERVLIDISQLSKLTSLVIRLEADGAFAPIPLRSMQPLARLRESLTQLTIYRNVDTDVTVGLSRDHIDFLRSLHRLKSISLRGIGGWSTQALEWIAAEPRMMQLRSLDIRDTIITAAHAVVLPRFTWLTGLDVWLGDPTFLASLTQLTSVGISSVSQEAPVSMATTLSHCTRLEKMRLIHPGLTSEHLCALLPLLPLLADLELMIMSPLTTLAFASSVCHLARTPLGESGDLRLQRLHHTRAG